VFEVAPLVLLALAADEVGVEVDPVRPDKLAALDGELKRGQVRAGEEVIEIGRRKNELDSAPAHLLTFARTQEGDGCGTAVAASFDACSECLS